MKYLGTTSDNKDHVTKEYVDLHGITAAEREAWNAKQNALTFDSTPTSGSSNPVTSGGVYAVLGDVESLLAAI